MKKYKVKPGCTVIENGAEHKEGSILILPAFRAEQIGIDKLEEVIETVKASTGDASQTELDALSAEVEKLNAELESEKIKSADLEKGIAGKQTELDALSAEVEKLNAELDKLKKKK